MRPLRFLLLLFCFVALPIILTCVSLLGGKETKAESFQYGQRSRFSALFSFSTPSSLFPPSAVISLTTDNSTFFLARPAAFGPSLPSQGLSGKLWVGKGFGDDTFFSGEDLKVTGFELGCSDVPGWAEDSEKTSDKSIKEKISTDETPSGGNGKSEGQDNIAVKKRNEESAESSNLVAEDDGTDDYLHHPLPNSNPASQVKVGEPADANTKDKTKSPVHADIESLQESAHIAGKIVLLSRGGCGFLEKVKWAQRRGGIALIVGDNERNGQLTVMYAKGDTSNITIPAIFTSYTSAHLLSSLVPRDIEEPNGDTTRLTTNPVKDGNREGTRNSKTKSKDAGPVFTSTSLKTKETDSTTKDSVKSDPNAKGWMQNVLQAVGFDEESLHAEDSRRPPSSGNIEWIQVQDWEDDDQKVVSTGTQKQATMSTSTRLPKVKSTSKIAEHADFTIGVQDWRDKDLIAPNPTQTSKGSLQKGKSDGSVSTATDQHPKETTLKGGSITPGSGEYVEIEKANSKGDSSNPNKHLSKDYDNHRSVFDKIKCLFRGSNHRRYIAPHQHSSAKQNAEKTDQLPASGNDEYQDGLWVTLTPTSVSTNPFFDTLLVLVVSPLVTLTVVYALLLLRSRIRRRRWRAPKSIVEQLPVRTFHTTAAVSSTTSSQLPSPSPSSHSSPQLRPAVTRQRSQTTAGVLSPKSTSQSPPLEKTANKPKRYTGRQLECVVCLEDYVDGESRVMSLPCGHEFHVDCITPWLVNRRRTCPICKGDVVRSLTRAAIGSSMADEDNREPGEQTSDDIQDRAATTVAEDASSAIPIPDRPATSDVERGEQVDAPLLGPISQRNPQGLSIWRGVINASVNRLSGATVWRSNSLDRNR